MQGPFLQIGRRKSGSGDFGVALWKGWRRKEKKLFFSGCAVFVVETAFSFACTGLATGSRIVRALLAVELCEPEPEELAEWAMLDDVWLLAEWLPDPEPLEELV